MTNYRIEALVRLVKTELIPSLKERGLIKPDYERIGIILTELYKGEEEKFEVLLEKTTNLRKETEKFLEKIKDK